MKRFVFAVSVAAGIVLLSAFRQDTRLVTTELEGRWDLTLAARERRILPGSKFPAKPIPACAL
jgi:hypothetical protein